MSRSWRKAALAVAFAALCEGAAAQAVSPGWALRVPKAETVEFHGIASFDTAGVGAAGMLYPAPNVVGLLAAVLTHGALVEASKERQKSELQQAADKVLEPYQGVLSGFTYQELMQRAAARPEAGVQSVLGADEPTPASGWIESAPVLSMTPDRRALVLETALLLRTSAQSEPLYQNTVRVVSASRPEGEAADWWSADGGEHLKAESAALMAESVRIALVDMQRASRTDTPGRQKTVRYTLGGAERIERAEVMSEDCAHRMLKTLRGWLLSVPGGGTDCPGVTASAR